MSHRVALNAQLLSGQQSYRAAGIHRYICSLIEHLPDADARFAYTAFTSNTTPTLHPSIAVQHTSLKTERPFTRIFWEQMIQPFVLSRSGAELVHCMAFVAPLVAATPSVITIHDLSFRRAPERFRGPHRAYLNIFTQLSCQRAKRLIAVSKFTKQEVMDVYGVPADKIDVVYSGVDAWFAPPIPEAVAAFRELRGLPEKFILYVGTIEPRKNLSTLIRAYAKLRPNGVKLICAGGRGWMYEDVFQTVEELRVSRDVIFPGYVAENDLPMWYAAAKVFVYPSTYEGFGLPVIEAMACGTPTITTHASSLPEAAGDAGLLVPPDDADALSDALARVLDSDSLREELSARGMKHTDKFTWVDTARDTAQVYARALGL
jgi:glycosyltransferase involved in cell wall biosynthesis